MNDPQAQEQSEAEEVEEQPEAEQLKSKPKNVEVGGHFQQPTHRQVQK